jgi:hypothetical protein
MRFSASRPFAPKPSARRDPQSGSVIFFIFIAIALFGALAFAIAQMLHGGENLSKNTELFNLQASEVMQYARVMRTAAQTMQINGISDAQISFENPTLNTYVNAGCSVDSCRIFRPDGGGVSYAIPSAEWLDSTQSSRAGYGQWLFTGANEVTGIGADGAGADTRELLMVLPWVKHDLCVEIDKMLNIPMTNSQPPRDDTSYSYTVPFTGAYAADDAIGGDPGIDGHREGCFEGGGTPPNGTYHFYQVLIAR